MDSELKKDLVSAVIRIKRVDMQSVNPSCMQQTELLIISRAANGCASCDKGYTVSEIHKDLHLSKPAVSQTLNSLEKKGYISRAIDPDDRRKITVMVTDTGEAKLKEAQNQYDQVMDRVISQYGEENTRQLISLIYQLVDILEEE